MRISRNQVTDVTVNNIDQVVDMMGPRYAHVQVSPNDDGVYDKDVLLDQSFNPPFGYSLPCKVVKLNDSYHMTSEDEFARDFEVMDDEK